MEHKEHTDDMVVHLGRTTGHPRVAEVPAWLLDEGSVNAVLLYARMSLLAQEREGDLVVQLRLATLAETMNVSLRTVQKALRDLRLAGAIRVEPTFNDDGITRLPNRYVLQPFPPQRGNE